MDIIEVSDIRVKYLTTRVSTSQKKKGVKMHYAKITFLFLPEGVEQVIMTQPWMNEQGAQRDANRIVGMLKSFQPASVPN